MYEKKLKTPGFFIFTLDLPYYFGSLSGSVSPAGLYIPSTEAEFAAKCSNSSPAFVSVP